MASLKRKRLNSASDERTANTVQSLRADGSSSVQVGNSYTEVHNHEGHQADDECLRDLRTTDPRIDRTRIENDKGGLVQGSCNWVLEDSNFQQWRQRTNDRLLWVKGDPGKGKTMLLCAYLILLLCQATDSRINNATSVLRGLIYLLVVQDTSLTRHVRNKWDHGGKSTFDPPNGWHALCNMLDDILHDHSKPTCLVIDALDECEGGSLSSLLNLIVSTASKFHHIKWLVSSRNLPDIERGLGGANVGGRLDISLEANAGLVSKAVANYIDHKIDNLAKLSSELDLRKKVKETMQHKANGTFLWAALAFEELKTEEDEELEDNSEMLDVLDQVPEGLTNLYDRMWRQVSTQGSKNSRSCKAILATMFLAYRPLQLQELPMLAGLKGNLANHDTLVRLVRRCGCFLTIQKDAETVHFVHQSAKDFLTDNKNAFDGIFPSGMGGGHHQLFSRSVEAMATGLRQNIYGLGNPGVLTSEIEVPVPDPLAVMRYSCVRWVDHFYEWVSSKRDRDYNYANDVATFLQDKYLYWLEALGLCGNVIEGIASIRKLEALAAHNQWNHLATLVRDARRFVLANRQGIETAPLQVYVSALIFCPTSSWVRKRYETMIPEWIKKKPIIQPEWDACLLTLEGHENGVQYLAFSPDSRIIASSSWKGTIKIWDPYTGACLNTISGCHGRVYQLAFLSNGPSTILASAGKESDGYSIKIWDPFNGGPPQRTFTMPSRMSKVITFIKGSNIAVWVDEAGTLIKLDLDTGAFLDPIKLPAKPIAVSPDGQTIITSDGDCCQVWGWSNPETDRLTLDGCIPEDDYVVVSLDSTKLVCVSETRFPNIEMWDLTTGFCFTIPYDPGSLVTRCLAFSPDGTMVAVGNDIDGTVNLWDTTTGTVQVFSGHSDAIKAVAISPNDRLSASGCDDNTIKIWDPTVRAPLDSDKGPTEGPEDWLLSPNGLWVASRAYDDDVIRIWSSVTSEIVFNLPEPQLEWGDELADMLIFSPCDRWLAVVDASSIKIWDTITWKIQPEFKGLAFSLSTNNLAFVPYKSETVEIWDLHTSELKSKFSSPLWDDDIFQTLFSPNGLWLAIASTGGLEIWDWAAKQCMQVDNGDPGEISWHPNHGGLLHTSYGSYCVQESTGNCSVDKAQTQDEDKHPVQMTEDSEWVIVQGKRALWIPSQYRPRFKYNLYGPVFGKAVDGNKLGVAMLDNCNRVIHIEFDVTEIALNF
ncbi:hypothetical protein LCI18_014143 [Fusarium solani-melongenae]|uniref:Uncharacterized protein n=1 Tax=Fusarium solani subsp. cucurbitae TaxID=2747967 RepID=A0ACD3ZPD5_FUSSC|nr:hypothetical protein LCI18_014143 [Fusarium solani-melongenae]